MTEILLSDNTVVLLQKLRVSFLRDLFRNKGGFAGDGDLCLTTEQLFLALGLAEGLFDVTNTNLSTFIEDSYMDPELEVGVLFKHKVTVSSQEK